MSVLDIYNAFMEIRQSEDFNIAETMYLLSREGDLDLDFDTLHRLSEKTMDACYLSPDPLLHAERVEAVRSIFDIGLKGDRAYPFPDLPQMSQEQLAEMLLCLSDNSFMILMDTVAYNNRDHYYPEFYGSQDWKQDVKAATKEIEAFLGRELTLDRRIKAAATLSPHTVPADGQIVVNSLNKLPIYTVSLVDSMGYWDGSESSVKSFVSKQESLDYAYEKYCAFWENAARDEAPALEPLLSRDAFDKAIAEDTYVCIQFDDYHIQVEVYEQELELVPQKTSSLDDIIRSVAKEQQNQATKEFTKSDDLSR